MRRRPTALSLIVAVVLAPSAWAQSSGNPDELYDLATIEADHEICGFALSDEQREVIAQRRDALVAKGDVSETEVAAVQEQVLTALTRQKTEGLCRPDGAEAQSYKRRLISLGLL